MTVRELEGRMDADEVTYWMAYERIAGPLGGERADWLAAMIAERITVMQTAKKSDRRRIKITDFVPQWGGKQQAASGGGKSPGQMANALKALTRRLGGRILRDGEEV